MSQPWVPIRIHHSTYQKLQVIKGCLEMEGKKSLSISETIDAMSAMVAMTLKPPNILLLLTDSHGEG